MFMSVFTVRRWSLTKTQFKHRLWWFIQLCEELLSLLMYLIWFNV